MAASIERSRDIQMKICDVIGHVTALDQSEPSTQLTLPQNSVSGAIIGDDTWRPLVVKLISANQMLTENLNILSDNRGFSRGAPGDNKRTTNQYAAFQISTNQKFTQNLHILGDSKIPTYYFYIFCFTSIIHDH